MQLRSYQIKAIDSLRYSFNTKGKKSPLLVMPTGAGKTVVFAAISKAISQNKKNVLILVHRRELIDQASKKLKAIGVKHGVIAAKYKESRNNIQIASVQTLVRRLVKNTFNPNYIIIDEAHHAAAGSWTKIIDHFKDAYKIGCTATPIRLDGRGLADYFDDLVKGPGVAKLIDEKYLAPYKVFAPPLKVNLDKVKTLGGDYQKKELEKQIDSVDIIGDAVQQYKKHADGLPAIAFCISIKHATDVCNKFKDAGYKAAIVHGEMKVDDRDKAIKGLGNGKIQILTSVDVISEGTDVPDVSAAILLRPTKSEGLYLQQVGRVLRPKTNKTAIILDHVNSTRTHGFVDDKRDWSLHSQKKKKKKGELAPHVETCKKCFATYKPTPVCPVCGYQAENRERFIKQEEGELEELKRKEQAETEKQQQKQLIATARTLEELEMVAKILGYKKGWAYRVHESRKKNTYYLPKPDMKYKAKLTMDQKEKVARLFALNSVGFKMLKDYHNENYRKLAKNPNSDAGVIFKTMQLNSSSSFANRKLFKEWFFDMFQYSWDRTFIINYVSTVRNKNVVINPNSLIFINK
jgi:superfamily II DNA or RNA helicase|tara:strand:+ start:135 stop:1862 length:1728 start_codon:yes stop_codon:yes gene_type:complete